MVDVNNSREMKHEGALMFVQSSCYLIAADGRRDIDKAICVLVILLCCWLAFFSMIFQLESQKKSRKRQPHCDEEC